MFNWLARAGRIPFSPVLAIEAPRKGESRERVLTDDELVAVWRSAPDDTFGNIVRLLIITGQRPGQLCGLRGEYIDLTGRLIVWPAEVMKGNRRHVLPLTDLALKILKLSDPIPPGLLFPTKEGNPFALSGRRRNRLYALTGTSDFTCHDLRRCWATKAADWGIADPYLIEMVLAHPIKGISQVGMVYNRSRYLAPMRTALEQFEVKLLALVDVRTRSHSHH